MKFIAYVYIDTRAILTLDPDPKNSNEYDPTLLLWTEKVAIELKLSCPGIVKLLSPRNLRPVKNDVSLKRGIFFDSRG
jgi:hypothetical protein